MAKLLIKAVLFYLVFLAFISIPAVYDIFILGQTDRKFSQSPWMALQVYYFGSAWIWFYLALVFLVLSWLSNKLTKLDISYAVSIGIAILTAIVCFSYTRNDAAAWKLSLKPDYVGIMTITVIFLILSFLKYRKSGN